MSNKGIVRIPHAQMQEWIESLPQPAYGLLAVGKTGDLLRAFGMLTEIFQMPKSYSMEALFYNCVEDTWYLVLASEHIPTHPGYVALPTIHPVYAQDEAGHTCLVALEYNPVFAHNAPTQTGPAPLAQDEA